MAEFVQSEIKVIKPEGAILVSSESLEKFWNELGDILTVMPKNFKDTEWSLT